MENIGQTDSLIIYSYTPISDRMFRSTYERHFWDMHVIFYSYQDIRLIWRFEVSRQAAQKVYGERFNLGKLNDQEERKQYQIDITNRFAPLGNLSDNEDINRAWENIKENIGTSAKESLGVYELKQHKLCFDEECLHFLDQRRPAKMQWVQDPSQSNEDNVKNVYVYRVITLRNDCIFSFLW